MFSFLKALINRLHFKGAGKVGVVIGGPGIGLLVNQDYASKLAHAILPNVNDAFVPLIGAVVVGVAGLILLYSKSPAAPTFTPNS
jgi:hypothetical protein